MEQAGKARLIHPTQAIFRRYLILPQFHCRFDKVEGIQAVCS